METLGSLELARLLLALTLLLAFAHIAGYLATRVRQPRVIGEIVGGLLLGPTVLGAIAPGLHDQVFPATGPVPVVLDAMYQLGLLLLMFSAGSEIRSSFKADERRTVAAVTITGMVFPFLVGLGFVALLPEGAHIGPAADRAAFVLVFALAIAVTSIPVISRIMFDLGILETAFARIVLAVAVLEDVVIYVLLAIALGLVAGSTGAPVGLPALLDLVPGSPTAIGYHVVATVGFLGLALWLGPPVYRAILRFRYNLVKRGSAIAFQILFMLAVTMLAVALDVIPLFGAFVAGIVVGSAEGTTGAEAARGTIRISRSRSSSRCTSRSWACGSTCSATSSPCSSCCSSRSHVWPSTFVSGPEHGGPESLRRGLATSPLLSMHEAARESCSPRWPSTPASSTAASTQCS